MPLICWGRFTDESSLDPDTHMLRSDVAAELLNAGLSYMQSDALAINATEWRRIAPLLDRVA
jgi:hypothetical protein